MWSTVAFFSPLPYPGVITTRSPHAIQTTNMKTTLRNFSIERWSNQSYKRYYWSNAEVKHSVTPLSTWKTSCWWGGLTEKLRCPLTWPSLRKPCARPKVNRICTIKTWQVSPFHASESWWCWSTSTQSTIFSSRTRFRLSRTIMTWSVLKISLSPAKSPGKSGQTLRRATRRMTRMNRRMET